MRASDSSSPLCVDARSHRYGKHDCYKSEQALTSSTRCVRLERLRIMLSLAEATERLHGGALASAVHTVCADIVCIFENAETGQTILQVHAHMQHGDPMTGAFVERQMRALATPLLDMVKQWVTEGQLTDPFEVYSCLYRRASRFQSSSPCASVQEFFVAKHSDVPDECYWSSKYSLNAAMIPTFIDRCVQTVCQ